MSDSEKPESTPAGETPPVPETVKPAPAEEAVSGETSPRKPQGKWRRPGSRVGPVPSLEEEHLPRSPLRLKELDAAIENDLQEALAGLGEQDFLLAEPAGPRRPPSKREKGPKKGKVLSVHGQDVFVEVPGGRSQGVLSLEQFPEGTPAPGTEVDIDIEGYDGSNGLLLLSRRGAAVTIDWSSVAVAQTVEAKVTGTNKGGLAVEVNGIRAFMPLSQIDLYRVENAEQFLNQRLVCLVTEVNPQERNLIVSRRAYLEKEREEKREKLWAELGEGQIRPGVVRSVRDFGAFVDLGGVDGLLHVSQMSWTRVADPAALVQPGQTLQVVILKIDRERRKVGLGLKQLLASPWDNIQEKYHVRQVVPGKVTRLADFGAFVELEPGVEGLIHISELAPQKVRRVGEVVHPGQEIQVMVLNVDPEQRRISLSLKAAMPEDSPAEEPEETSEPAPETPRPRNWSLRGGIGNG